MGETSQGRFLIQSKQFLDPEIFKPARLATFSGNIHAQQQKRVDKKTLYLPVIQMHEMHLWSEKKLYRQPYLVIDTYTLIRDIAARRGAILGTKMNSTISLNDNHLYLE